MSTQETFPRSVSPYMDRTASSSFVDKEAFLESCWMSLCIDSQIPLTGCESFDGSWTMLVLTAFRTKG